MDTRSELVRLAQAGEPTAIQSFIAQNHALIYSMALSILNEPAEAARAARSSAAALIEHLSSYPGPAAHTAWVYRLTLEVCRRQLRWRAVLRRLPRGLRARLQPRQVEAPAPVGWAAAADALPDHLRLPLVLRYRHDLLPAEIAEVLGWRDAVVQSRLRQARALLRRTRPETSRDDLPAGPEENLRHSRAEALLEAAADFQITDADAVLLSRHLKMCARCHEASRRLTAFENELRAAFQQRWSAESVPVAGAAAAAVDQRRRQTARRHSLNLAGAVLAAFFMVAVIVLLPALRPDRILPPPPAAPPPAPTAAPTATEQPTLVPSSTPTARPTRTPTPTFVGITNTPRPVSRGDLLRTIYPGKIAYTTFSDVTDHVFTFEPGKRGQQQLSGGISENSFPVWSPDGTRLAYLSMPQSWGQNQIYVVDADGANRHQITPAGSAAAKPDAAARDAVQYPLYGPPHWSADNQSVVSAVWASPTSHFIAIFPVDGGDVLRLPVQGLSREYLDWSPDNSTIAYLAKDGTELWLWEPGQPVAVGKNPRLLYGQGAWDVVYGLAWSPDSYSVAVLGGLREQDVVQVDLRIVRKYGLEVQNLPISTGILTRTPQYPSGLAWSADGRYLAFTSIFTNNDLVHGKVMLLRADGHAAVLPPLAVLDREVTGLAWSPDGRWLAYAAGTEVWAASLEAFEKKELALVRLTRLVGYSLAWQPVRSSSVRQ